MKTTIRWTTGAAAAAAIALAACGADSTGTTTANTAGGTPTTFLAFTADFASYQQWDKFAVPDSTATDPVHTANPRTEYLNRKPPHGSSEYPVGTVIVHEVAGATPADMKIFAMVKRGGDFNKDGAQNWEWFELTHGPTGMLQILWRGVGPPAGEMYGGDPSGGCNSCHGGAKSNDFVQSQALQLSNF
jgi:hypothetical protein